MNLLKHSSRPYNLKTYVEILKEGLEYVEDRQKGKIRSFALPWDSINRFGVGGLEWGSMLTVGARPGAGKTMFVSQILRESKLYNPKQNFNILEFQFEMAPKQTAARDFVSQLALDYNEVLSVGSKLDDFYVERIKNYIEECEKLEKMGVYRVQINESLTAPEIGEAIYRCYTELNSAPLVVTIDHSWLIKKGKGDKDKFDVLYNTVEMLMHLKNKLPIIVIMITQLNRNIDETSRKVPGTIGNYPTSSDIFGGDALMQGSDMVLALNRPYKADINLYGPKEYVCGTDDIFVHIIKSRNSNDDNNLLFMKADFTRQRIYETIEPASNNPTGLSPARRRRTQTTIADPNLDVD